MNKLMLIGLSAIALVGITGCSSLSEWYDAQLLQWREAQEREYRRLAGLPPAQAVQSPNRNIAFLAKQSCDLFNMAQPKMRAYIALTENSYEYNGFVNDVRYYIENEKMTEAEAQKKVYDAVIAADATRPDDEKVWPKILKGAAAARQFGPQSERDQMMALLSRSIEISAAVVNICKTLRDRQKKMKKLVKEKKMSKKQMKEENGLIMQRLAECSAIQMQLSEAGRCISFMMDQYNRAKELEREAAR